MNPTTATELFDKVAEITGIDYNVCKSVVYCLLYQGPIVRICLTYRLTLGNIKEIRDAFADIVNDTVKEDAE
jgi:hypothetical protein